MRATAAIFGCEGAVLGTSEAAFFREARPWGFILFARNLETPDQIRRLTADLRAAAGTDLPIFIDQEGGRVARLTAPDWRVWLPALDQVAVAGPKAAARSLWLRSRLIADELRALGIDGNCAPVCDVATEVTHPVLLNRTYGHDADTVTRHARAVAEGTLAGGVLPVMKHIPGHGRGAVDSHLGLPRVGTDLATLEAQDFAPFRALADLPLAMTAHVVFDALDVERPATTSAKVLRMIRDDIGFDGLLMTDDLSMEALAGSVTERTQNALRAGCDLILHCNGHLAEMQAVARAAGALTDAAAGRGAGALRWRKSPEPIDIAQAEAELALILQEG